MKKTNKFLALVLTLIMMAGIICSCGAKKASGYEVLVNDANGNPVPGVTIQFCSDTECSSGQTGEDGIAVFDKEAGSYTVHVLSVPDGYAADSTEYEAPAQPDRMTIVLNQA